MSFFHSFGLKLAIFPPFFLSNTGQENVFYNILERKNASLGYKNNKFKKSKNKNLFFKQYRTRTWVLWYSTTKNNCLGFKIKQVKN